MERQFLATLKADTGRAVDEWMAAIAAANMTSRNDIIDWLRRQGFMFSKASWLERIHNNGGKPIYGDGGSAPARTRPRRAPAQQPRSAHADTPASPRVATAAPAIVAPAPPSTPSAHGDQAAIDALLAKAKAYRPLATFVMTELRKAHPAAAVEARDGHLAFADGARVFAVLTVGPKELRLGLALEDRPRDAALEPAKLPPGFRAPAITHAVTLTDARQMTPALRDAIRSAGRAGAA
jgi:hypothetical protein